MLRPLSSIKLAAQVLRADNLSEGEREQQLDQLQKLSNQTIQLVESLLLISDDEPTESVKPANIVEIVQTASEDLQSWFKDRQRPFRIYPRPLQPLVVRRRLVNQIIQTLLTTAPAVDSTQPIEIRFRKNDSFQFVRIRDYNSKMSLDDWRRLNSQQFASVVQPQSESANSSGFDLYVARQLAERVGGKIEFEPKQIGNCFQLKLPALHQPQIWQASKW